MVLLRLIEIEENGNPVENVPLCEMASSVCEAISAMYRGAGFVRPWVGYLAMQDRQVVGTCSFKSPPQNSRVEIAYFTFPNHEGRGVATEMARRLVIMARAADNSVIIVAQTLPEENASTAILRRLGFDRTGVVQHPDDGEVWEWSLPATQH